MQTQNRHVAKVDCPLFGGALSAAFPHNAVDVSELREIPDNQEVFVHVHTDQSIIIELLEYQSQVDNENAARETLPPLGVPGTTHDRLYQTLVPYFSEITYHFEDVAGSNKALEPGGSEVQTVVALPNSELSMLDCSSAWLLTGTQCVSKFNEESKNIVTIHLGLFRLPQYSTDVLVTFNDPLNISPEGSSAMGIGTLATEPWTQQDFQCLLKSVTLHNPGVFG